MQEEDENKKKAPSPPKTYTIKDVVNFENNDIYSAFGSMQLSSKTTAAKYGFGKAEREKVAKVYQSKAHSRTQFIGKVSLGPNFEGTDRFEYDKAPEWVFGKQARNTLDIKQPYDHYSRVDAESDPIDANILRKPRADTLRFGTAKRFIPGVGETRGTPGPKYTPNLKPEIRNSDKYSFGHRRDVPGYAVLTPLVSTTGVVGPGKYYRYNPVAPNTSLQQNQPKHKFPEHIRFHDGYKNPVVNETYEKYNSVSNQVRSAKTSEPKINFTKSTRESKAGQFKDMMATQSTRVVIPMPRIK